MRAFRTHLKTLAGLALGLVLLWLVFRGTDWNEVFAAISSIDPLWFALAQVPIWISFFARIQRWTYVVRTSGPVTYRAVFSATQIAFLANILLPGRVGEIIRAVVLSRLSPLGFSKSLAMAALDRVNDLVGLLVVLCVTVYAFHTYALSVPATVSGRVVPENILQIALLGAAAVIVGAVGALIVLYINQRVVLRVADAVLMPLSEKLAARVHHVLEQFAQGLHIFRSGGELAKSIGFSLVVWACFVAANEATLRAFHIAGPWYTPFVFTTFVAVAVSIPGAPGFIGQYHFAVVATLAVTLPNVPLEQAKAVALVAHVINLLPVLLLGLYSLYLENMSLLMLRSQSEEPQPIAEA
jgi:hypothetical protein